MSAKGFVAQMYFPAKTGGLGEFFFFWDDVMSVLGSRVLLMVGE